MREQTHPVCLHAVEKYEMITKQQVKNEQIKRKHTYSVYFVKVFKFQKSKFKIVNKRISRK